MQEALSTTRIQMRPGNNDNDYNGNDNDNKDNCNYNNNNQYTNKALSTRNIQMTMTTKTMTTTMNSEHNTSSTNSLSAKRLSNGSESRKPCQRGGYKRYRQSWSVTRKQEFRLYISYQFSIIPRFSIYNTRTTYSVIVLF